MKPLFYKIYFVLICLLSIHALDAQPLKRAMKEVTVNTAQEETARAVVASQAVVKAVHGQRKPGIATLFQEAVPVRVYQACAVRAQL